jgi:hypothetical protein
MPAVELDRQGIERRDFPIGRRGYDPAAVDAHLRALAVEFEELQRTAATGGPDLSMASTAGAQVQSIIAAAEAAGSEIERQAVEGARQVREAADREAERTREEAIEKARSHIAAVAQVAATLLERVGAMDAEVRGMVDSLRAGAGRLAGDLAAVESNMGELYDAASGAGAAGVAAQPPRAQPPAQSPFEAELAGAMATAPATAAAVSAPSPEAASESRPEPAAAAGSVPDAAAAGDIDGARLIALNMALNGEAREDTERYLAENFQLPDRAKLVDEVYAAIEG